MDKLQLEYFQVIARLEHITKAAEKLNISQPALSASIRRLEAELGVKLFDRHGRNISLNAYGRLYLRYVDDALARLDAAQQQLQALQKMKNNSVRLLSPPLDRFPGLLESIIFSGFNLSLDAINESESSIIGKFVSKEIDLCITTIPLRTRSLARAVLTAERMAALVPASHPLASRSSISITELKNLPFTSFHEGSGPRIQMEYICNINGFSPNVVFSGDRVQDILRSVLVGNYVTILTKQSLIQQLNTHFSEPLHDFSILDIDEPDCTMTRMLYWWEGDERQSVNDIKQIIIDYFAKNSNAEFKKTG